jgi:MFS family permease
VRPPVAICKDHGVLPYLGRILPPTSLERRLVVQSVLSAFATGSFLTGTAVFFTQIVGLSASQVGLGLSLSGLVVFALSVPAGRLADRIGARRLWLIASVLEALAYLAFPAVRGFAAFAILMAVLGTIETAARSGRGAYWLVIFERETRVRGMAYMRSARNIGYTLGAAAGGFALAIGTRPAIIAVPLLTAFLLVVNAVLISRMPDVRRSAGADLEAVIERVRPEAAAGGVPGLRNAGFVVLGLASGVLGTNQVLLNIVVPLWLVERTDAPHILLAWLFGTNTVMAVLLQVRAARGADTVAGCLRLTRWCAWSFVLSCVLIAVTHDTVGWVSIVLIWAGHVTITGAELWQSAASWGFLSELSDPSRLGEYQGVFQLGWQAAAIIGPALFTWLAMEQGAVGWAVIAAIAVAAAAVSHPAARIAEARLQREAVAEPAVRHTVRPQ